MANVLVSGVIQYYNKSMSSVGFECCVLYGFPRFQFLFSCFEQQLNLTDTI